MAEERKPYILVVDDQPGVRRLVAEALRDERWDVDMAASGAEALEKIQERMPDLIFIDLKMPGMNGLETVREIRRMEDGGGKVEIVLMTAYGELHMLAEAERLGIKDHVMKPFDINILRELAAKTVLQENVF
ncbi:MAG: two-component system, response regulator, stage 0 sporulation protein [Eubacteriales bacterium]|nr:two-component system, response regulator, stage 0 sporulation protein [Eubacteriales bacterium]MDN5363075.1 two-component system, response regulator, stage 0 sporulation protein [Eubacteriales bacterium]